MSMVLTEDDPLEVIFGKYPGEAAPDYPFPGLVKIKKDEPSPDAKK